MKILILLFAVISFVNGRTLLCHVVGLEKQLDCKILSKDLRDMKEGETIEFDSDDEELEDFTRVSIVETKLNDIPGGIFETFPSLTEFVVSENELKEWKPQYLKGATTLKHLYVAYNPLTHLKANSFDEAPNLEIIEFIYNNLADIDANAFAGLPRLNELRFNNNKIGTSLKSETFSEVAESLTKLNLGSNEIAEIPEGMLRNLKNLQQLSLYLNKLKTVDGSVFPKSLKKFIGLIQFEIVNPPENLEYEIEKLEKRDEL